MAIQKVLVTGATGQTGSIVVHKLRERTDRFEVVCFARSAEKAQEKLGSVDGVEIGDVMDRASIDRAIAGCDALVILSSSVLVMKGPPQPGQRPEFEFLPGAYPEDIDYNGQRNLIDAAVAVGVQHIVQVGSMGGTDKNHYLNTLGNGNVLIWKRQAEQYLIDSGIHYTIVRAGGLIDERGGHREILVGKDDSFFIPEQNMPHKLPRADVAEVVVQALLEPNAQNKAFDVVTREEDEALPTSDFAALFAQTTPGL
ncbi:SDR family oxidoreductase [Acaryochloris sp. IP29b_bin.137]|uniref:SDR family oxidoreductase n=1 Tax=Acaryochloris sp. IP29b_bin.137 TaxID=2969217 RepID=UPI002607C7D1|nr:SDR family oxidoreductase [Acaryochloris sp. IP29b_bin.137]